MYIFENSGMAGACAVGTRTNKLRGSNLFGSRGGHDDSENRRTTQSNVVAICNLFALQDTVPMAGKCRYLQCNAECKIRNGTSGGKCWR
jgi:hypothetical protein